MQKHLAHKNSRWFRHIRDKKLDLIIFWGCPVVFHPCSIRVNRTFCHHFQWAELGVGLLTRVKVQIQHCYWKEGVLFKILKASLFLISAPQMEFSVLSKHAFFLTIRINLIDAFIFNSVPGGNWSPLCNNICKENNLCWIRWKGGERVTELTGRAIWLLP